MKNLSRPMALKIAAALSFLMNGYSLVNTLPLLAQGSAAVDQGHNSPPYVVLVIALLTSAVGIVGVYGTWKQERWGIILTIIVSLVNGLSAAPGILFAPQPGLMVTAVVSVAIAIVIIVLCLWRERKPLPA